MRYLIVSIVLLALLLGACSASSNPSPLPVVTYSTACLEDGEVPINVNPCLDRPTVQVEGESAMARPEEMPVHLYASVAGERPWFAAPTHLWCEMMTGTPSARPMPNVSSIDSTMQSSSLRM